MKTPKSSDSEDVTPSKKVLKQARLPFKTITDVSPKTPTPVSRKRKLSVQTPEPVTKVGKVPKKDEQQDILVISDDDSNTASEVKKDSVQLNPFVKLVDTAWKKKLQKSKGTKKRKGGVKKSKTVQKSESVENNENSCDGSASDKVECVEEMDIDGATEDTESEDSDKQTKVSENDTVDIKDNSDSTDNTHNSSENKPGNLLEDSHSSTDSKNDIKSNIKPLRSKQNNKNSDTDEQEDIDKKEVLKDDSSLPKSPKKGSIKKDSSLEKSPKKSERIKSKIEDSKNLDTSVSSNCDESLSSNPSTPRRSNRNLSLTNSQGDVSMTDSTNTNLTPKQLQKKLESSKKKEDREKERLDREKKKQLEKEEREKQKKEKDEQKKREREEREEAKKKEREEKEEQRKKEKEEKEKQREIEKKMREEKEEQKRKEKEEKEEQRKKEKEAREEEKRKRQEAIDQEKLDQEQKKKKAAEAFVSFFVPKQKAEKDQVTIKSVSKNDMLSSFTIKSDMRLAPTTRVSLNHDEIKCLDSFIQEQNVPEKLLYIKSLKGGLRKPLTDVKTWPLSDKDDNDDDVMIVEDELPPPVDSVSQIITCDSVPHEKLRPKLLAFHDNRRPPYWGTWRKKSAFIKARQPFKTDEKLLDYEVDSDEDWEEEQDGESIDGSAAGSEDEQDADEYEVDNEVFVPHGYLSDEEATMDEDDVQQLSPETQKARLKHLEDEFENEMKKPTEKLKPWFYGLSWETEDAGKPEKCADSIWNYFGKFAMIMNDPTPLLQPSNESVEPEKKKVKKKKATEGDEQSPKNEKKKKSKVDEKDAKKPKSDNKKTGQEALKNQPGINSFLKKLNNS